MPLNIPELHINNFTYDLPTGKIAVYPLQERDQSKVLIWKDGQISESVFAEIDKVVPGNALLVFNNTRVIHARLHFQRETGSRIEIFCLEPHKPTDYQISFKQTGSVEWKCLVGNAKKWKHGVLKQRINIDDDQIELCAEVIEKQDNAFIIRFSWDKPVIFADIIEVAGKIPIPPYLNRAAEESDNQRYQTLYAKIDGSVAAPTAGLHFTTEVIEKLKKRNISTAELTLHVGAGTFQPVKSDKVSGHIMHTETVSISRSFLMKLTDNLNNLIAVGTTSVRALESLYWLGAKNCSKEKNPDFHVSQWEPYQETIFVSVNEALQNLVEIMDLNKVNELTFTTSIIIVPGYNFRLIKGMFTNFHQPQSTLLLLVAAFLGDKWRKLYEYALQNNYRFLSYGDSNFYLKTT